MPKKKKRTTKKRKDTKKKLVRKKKVTRKRKSETVAGQKKYHRGGQVKGYTFGEALHSKDWP